LPAILVAAAAMEGKVSTAFIYRHATYLMVVVCFAGANSFGAQQSLHENNSRYWFGGGLGISSLGDIAGSADACIQSKAILFSLRLTANSAGLFRDEFFDIGLLIGPVTRSRNGHASIGIGISQVTGSRCEGLNIFSTRSARKDITPTIGLPIEAQLFRNMTDNLAIGFYVYGNVNAEENFGGVTLSLQFGKLR
jgi:hypothetical protein